MIWLLQDLGYLSVVLRAMTLVLQTLMVGGIVFAVWVLPRRAAEQQGNCLRWLARFGCALAVAQVLYVATDSAVLMGSTGIALRDLVAADYFVAGGVGFAAAVATALCAGLRVRGTAWRWLLPTFGALAMASSLCTSHAVSRMDDRVPLAVLTVLHQGAAAVWMGGLFFLLLMVRGSVGRAEDSLTKSSMTEAYIPSGAKAPIFPGPLTAGLKSRPFKAGLHPIALHHVEAAAPVLRRFSVVAWVAAGTLVLSGVMLSVFYVGSLPALYGTAYGFMIVNKAVLLLSLVALGAMNHSIARKGRFAAVGMTLLGKLGEAELWFGLAAILAAASLTSQPPAVDLTQDRLAWHEIVERFTPKVPNFNHPGAETLAPATPTEQAVRNVDNMELAAQHSNGEADMLWDEFDHHWAGLMVLFIGIGAFLSPRFKWARNWPLIFFAMTVFLLLYADPENWPIGPVGFWQSFADPEVLQHRIYFCLLMVYGSFEWAVQTGRLRQQWAASVFPLMLGVGGAALLLHSHSLGNVKQELLLEMSHNTLAVLGMGIGCARWVEVGLRGVAGTERVRRVAAQVWPACFVLAALVLLNYREH